MKNVAEWAVVTLALFATVAALIGCRGKMKEELKVGGLYSVDSGNGKFGIAKVLALEPSIVHVRLYKNKFDVTAHLHV